MGIVGRVIRSFGITRRGIRWPIVLSELYKGQNTQTERFGPSGDDSPPLPGDATLNVDRNGSGRYAYAGSIDIKNGQTAESGEKYLYSRNAAGAIQATAFFRADGTLELNGSANSAVQFQALQTAFNLLRTELNAAIAAQNIHIHTLSPSVAVVSIPTVPATPAVADMSAAELATIKVP